MGSKGGCVNWVKTTNHDHCGVDGFMSGSILFKTLFTVEAVKKTLVSSSPLVGPIEERTNTLEGSIKSRLAPGNVMGRSGSLMNSANSLYCFHLE